MKTERRPLSEKQVKDLTVLFEHPGMEVLMLLSSHRNAELLAQAAQERSGEDASQNEKHETSNATFRLAEFGEMFLELLSRYKDADPARHYLITIQP